MNRRTVTAVIASGALGLGGVALLAPQPASAADQAVSAVSASVDGPQSAVRHRLLNPAQRKELRSTGHLTLTVHTKKHGTVTVIVQRGEVTALSPTSISLRSKDGWTHTYVVTDRTKVREHRQPVDYSELSVGEKAMVIAVQTDKGDVARRIGCLSGQAASQT